MLGLSVSRIERVFNNSPDPTYPTPYPCTAALLYRNKNQVSMQVICPRNGSRITLTPVIRKEEVRVSRSSVRTINHCIYPSWGKSYYTYLDETVERKHSNQKSFSGATQALALTHGETSDDIPVHLAGQIDPSCI